MKSYDEVKKALRARCRNIRGFNKAFYKTFCSDLAAIQTKHAEAEKSGAAFSVTDAWRKTKTHETYFYIHNGSAYCAFLEII